MIVKVLLGILTGGAMFLLASSSFGANAAGVLWPGFTPGILISLGLGLAGLRMWDRKKSRQGTIIEGRYLRFGIEGGESSRRILVSSNKQEGGHG